MSVVEVSRFVVCEPNKLSRVYSSSLFSSSSVPGFFYSKFSSSSFGLFEQFSQRSLCRLQAMHACCDMHRLFTKTVFCIFQMSIVQKNDYKFRECDYLNKR